MCRRVQCPTCGKPTFVGCGLHVEQVLGDVPAADRCRCREEQAPKGDKPDAGPTGGLRGRLGALFGRR